MEDNEVRVSSMVSWKQFGRAASVTAMLAAAGVIGAAAQTMGQATDGAMGLQPAATDIARDIHTFHNAYLMPLLTAICVLVLGLLIYVMVRFNSKTNPEPKKFSHNTLVEIVWTVGPIFALLLISIPSFPLLFLQDDIPETDLTVKAVGNAWFWQYEYPDHGGFSYASNLLPENEADAQGVPYLLAVDEPLVLPANKSVRVIVTGADVIHAWTVPAFGVKVDAIPGRTNELWFPGVDAGVYYGQCSELCGINHAYMPIEVRVLPEDEFNAWAAEREAEWAGLDAPQQFADNQAASAAR